MVKFLLKYFSIIFIIQKTFYFLFNFYKIKVLDFFKILSLKNFHPMNFSKKNYSKTNVKEFRIHGSKLPTEKEPSPQVFVSSVFAPNSVVAESRFFKLLNKQYKIKATKGVVIKIEEVEQDNDYVMKNYGIKFLYRTRTGLLNGYKETRHINRVLAVSSFYNEFGSKHKLNSHEIYIISVDQLADEDVTKTRVLSFVGKDVKFPIFNKESNTDAEVVPVTLNIFN